MKHLTEEQLVSAFYGQGGGHGSDGSEKDHLAECEECRAAYSRLEAVLAEMDRLAVPERGEEYGREVWARLAPRLDEKPAGGAWAVRLGRWLFAPRQWAVAGAVAALVVLAFFAGRFSHDDPRQTAHGITPQARERILLVAVGEHLERSQMVLLEVMNAGSAGNRAPVDLTPERERADQLVAANRLYRQAAAQSGEAGLADVLGDLERALLEIARSPSSMPPREFNELRQRLEAQGIVFKVRVIDSQLEKKGSSI